MKMTAKFEAEGESFNACFEQLNSAFNAEFSASGGGQDGKDGATFYPSVSVEGVLSWTNNKGLDNPTPVNIKGKDGYTPIKGVDYFDGKNGTNGKDGKNGVDGKDGKDGYIPIKGTDYFTDEDVQEIAERAAEMVDVPEGGVTSWNDLTDKPFGGEISYDWVSVATGTYNKGSSESDTGIWGIPISSFAPIVGTTYKIEAQDAMFGGKKTITAEAKQSTKVGLPCVIIGDEGSELYYFATLNGSNNGTVYYTGTIHLAAFARIYEEQAVGTNIIPLDPIYLPKEVVLEEELDQTLNEFAEFVSQNFQTEEQVTALINNALGVIENGTY